MRYAVVIELRKNRLLAAWGGKRPGWIDEAIPEELNDAARAEWLRAAFRDSGMPSGRALLVLPRRDAVLLQLDIVAPEGASEADLHGMARLRLGAQSTIDAQRCVMDVVPSGEAKKFTVCAVPGDVADRSREELKAAGRSIAGMTTRSAGLGVMTGGDGVQMAVVAGEREIELAVVARGVPVLTRQLNRNGDVVGDAAKTVAEAHRSETSARMMTGLGEFSRVLLHCDGVIGHELTAQMKKEISIPIETFEPSVRGLPAELWPLMALAQSGRPPVLRMRRVMPAQGLRIPAVRIAIGLSSLAAIVLFGVLLVLSRQKAELRTKMSTLRGELVQLQTKTRELQRDEARLEHLRRWMERDHSWTAEIAALAEVMPERGVVIDRLNGSSSREVVFEAARTGQGRRYTGGSWTGTGETSFDMQASVSDRQLVQQLRQRLIDDNRFEVESKGPELPDRLDFRITVSPPKPEGETKPEKPR